MFSKKDHTMAAAVPRSAHTRQLHRVEPSGAILLIFYLIMLLFGLTDQLLFVLKRLQSLKQLEESVHSSNHKLSISTLRVEQSTLRSISRVMPDPIVSGAGLFQVTS